VGAVVALYAVRGTLHEMLFCVYGYNRDIYVAATKIDAARLMLAPLTAVKNFLLPVWTTSALGLAGIAIASARIARSRRGSRRSARPAAAAVPEPRPRPPAGTERGDLLLPVLALVAIGTTLSLFPGLRFFGHYFALALPFWAALAGVAIARMTRVRRRKAAAAVGAIVLVSLGFELAQRPWVRAARELREWVSEGGPAHPGDPRLWPVTIVSPARRRDGCARTGHRTTPCSSGGCGRTSRSTQAWCPPRAS
jgi:hypothetical protein